MNKKEKQEMIAFLKENSELLTQAEIAEKFKLSLPSVSKILKKNNLPFKSKKKLINIDSVVCHYENGKTVKWISSKTKSSPSTISQILQEAGYKTSNKLNLDDNKIIQLYLEGVNTVELAKMFNSTPGTIGARLKKHGITMRKGGQKSNANFDLIDSKKKIEDLISQGLNIKEMVEKVGCSPTYMNKQMKKFDVKFDITSSRIGKETHSKLLDKEYMFQKYIVEDLSSRDLAALLGTESGTVLKFLKQHDIKPKNFSLPKEVKDRIESKIWLNDQYILQQKSAREIAKTLGTTHSIVISHLEEAGIPLRKNINKISDLSWKLLNSKKYLQREYVDKKKNIKTIADELSVTTFRVTTSLNAFNIPIRTHSETMLGDKTLKILDDKEKLKALISDEHVKTVAKKLGVDAKTIINYLNKHNIDYLPRSGSSGEKELSDYLKSINISHEKGVRSLIPPQEVDIYIPSHNIAIEYNGLYWHSEKHRNKNYHYEKWKTCNNAGIQLIQIWEDEWMNKPEIIKNMLAHKLGVSTQKRVYGRKTDILVLSFKESSQFLNKNHIQGEASGSLYLGLGIDDELVAAIVFKQRSEDKWELVRYATNSNVIGGFSKLLKYFEGVIHPNKITTFADLCVSDGGLYKDNGFIMDKLLKPDYSYFVGGVREHKFGYRLKRFENDPDLIWEDGLSERELAELNGLLRVYDAGKQRWVKTF